MKDVRQRSGQVVDESCLLGNLRDDLKVMILKGVCKNGEAVGHTGEKVLQLLRCEIVSTKNRFIGSSFAFKPGECRALRAIEESVGECMAKPAFVIEVVDGIGAEIDREETVSAIPGKNRLWLVWNQTLDATHECGRLFHQVFTINFVARHAEWTVPVVRTETIVRANHSIAWNLNCTERTQIVVRSQQ